MVKNLPAMLRSRLHPWVKNIPRKKEWQPTPVFLSGESNGQKRLMGYSQSMGRKRVGHVWVTSAFIFTLNKHNVFIVFVFISQVITTMQMLTKEQQIRVLPLGTLWNVFPCIYLAADSWLIRKGWFRHRQWWLLPPPVSVLMEVICLTISEGPCRSMSRLWIFTWNQSQVRNLTTRSFPCSYSILVGIRTGPFTWRFLSFAPLIRSAHSFSRDFTLRLVMEIQSGEWPPLTPWESCSCL